MDELNYLMEFIEIMKTEEKDDFEPNTLKFPNTSSSIEATPTDFSLTENILGRGGYGFVLKAKHLPSGNWLAMKFQKLNFTDETIKINRTRKYKMLEKEIRGLKMACSPYVTQYFGSMMVGRNVILCMELMDFTARKLYKDVAEVCKNSSTSRFDEHSLIIIAISVLNALYDLKRTYRLIHRDIKPSNILLNSNGEVKITDFGLVFEEHTIARSEPFGTTLYLAPELVTEISCKPIDGRYQVEFSSKSDIWSLGITLVEIARFHHPYEVCKTIPEVYRSISMKESPVLTDDDMYSPEVTQLINQCLIKEEKRRPSLDDIFDKDMLHGFNDLEENKAYMKGFIKNYAHREEIVEEVDENSTDESSIIEDTLQQWKNVNTVKLNSVVCH